MLGKDHSNTSEESEMLRLHEVSGRNSRHKRVKRTKAEYSELTDDRRDSGHLEDIYGVEVSRRGPV